MYAGDQRSVQVFWKGSSLIRRRESGASISSVWRGGEHNRHKVDDQLHIPVNSDILVGCQPKVSTAASQAPGSGTTRDVRPRGSTLSQSLGSFSFTRRKYPGFGAQSISFSCFDCKHQASEKEHQSCCKGSAEDPAVCKECGQGYWAGFLVF